MKFSFLFLIFFTSIKSNAQKYALLDTRFLHPIRYVDIVTPMDKLNGFFPVERKILLQFINSLTDIENELSKKETVSEVKQYKFGCLNFNGKILKFASETRLDYVLTSNCDNVNIQMHLCDAKVSNGINRFFIRTWKNYIKNNLKIKQ